VLIKQQAGGQAGRRAGRQAEQAQSRQSRRAGGQAGGQAGGCTGAEPHVPGRLWRYVELRGITCAPCAAPAWQAACCCCIIMLDLAAMVMQVPVHWFYDVQQQNRQSGAATLTSGPMQGVTCQHAEHDAIPYMSHVYALCTEMLLGKTVA
jgi:hypothetical protein